MKIKVIKTILASQDETGSRSFEYKAGEVYDIYQELANVFINQGWGEEIKTQEIVEEIETQELEIKIETQDFPKKKKKNAN
jgi:hypothetical protein